MILKAEETSKRYFRKTGRANHFLTVQPTTLALEPGTVTALMGRSGSGKTTLLHMLAGLLRPTEGRVTLDGQSLYDMGDAALSRLRNTRIAVVPQGRSAIDTLSVLENVRQWLSSPTHLSQKAFDVRYIAEIPQNESGKVLYKQLPL